MPHYDPLTGHTLSPRAHDYEDGDERPLPTYPSPARAPQFTTDPNTELVEARLALQNSEACRAQAEQDYLRAVSERDAARADKVALGHIVGRWIDKYNSARADAERLAKCLILVMPDERALRMSNCNFDWAEIISSACQRRDWESAENALTAHKAALAPAAQEQSA